MSCTQDAPKPIDTGFWVKGDVLSKLELILEERHADGTRTPYPLADATSVTLELRSLERAAIDIDVTLAIDDVPSALVFAVDPAAGWTPASATRTSERFEGFIRVDKAAGPGWLKQTLLLTLRTAP